MSTPKNWKRWAVGGAAALALTAGTLWTIDNVSAAEVVNGVSTFAQNQGVMTPQLAQLAQWAQQGNPGGRGGRGMDGAGMMGAQGWMGEDPATYLADALGITVEELQAAQTSARDVAIDQAVTDGKLTQAEADQLKATDAPGLPFRGGNKADHAELLADALGITVDELNTAQETARAAALAQAVADGDLTQEEADLLTARQAFGTYQQEQRQAELKAELDQAVATGALTQEQADLLLENMQDGFGPGMGHGFGMGGPGMGRGHGMGDGFGPGMGPGMDGPGMNGRGGRGHGHGGFFNNPPQQPGDSQTAPDNGTVPEGESTPQSQSFSNL